METLDQSLLLAINGFHAPWADGMMWAISRTNTWVALYAALLFTVWKQWGWKECALIVLGVIGVVACCDQLASHVAKPLVERLRPTHDPALSTLIHTVYGYKGGLYGFFSSHAANTFGLATILTWLFRHKGISVVLYAWAVLSSYSRMYLGVHYPSDILCGMLCGVAIGSLVYYVIRRYVKNDQNAVNPKVVYICFALSLAYVIGYGWVKV